MTKMIVTKAFGIAIYRQLVHIVNKRDARRNIFDVFPLSVSHIVEWKGFAKWLHFNLMLGFCSLRTQFYYSLLLRRPGDG